MNGRNRIPTLCATIALMAVSGALVISCRDQKAEQSSLSLSLLTSESQPIGVASSILSLPRAQSTIPETPEPEASQAQVDGAITAETEPEAIEAPLTNPILLAALEIEARSLLVAAEDYANALNQNPEPKLIVDEPEITEMIIPEGKWGRRRITKMVPRYITIHSTQNYRKGANAKAHADLLRAGGMRTLSWHFTVDQHSIYQSLPTTEQGEHADYNGRGNQSSIGIEMCENWGNSLEETMDRTAHLIAWLMQKHNISIEHVVPHQHWRMIRRSDGRDLGHKNCPHFLMEEGEPGQKWSEFLTRAERIYRSGSL